MVLSHCAQKKKIKKKKNAVPHFNKPINGLTNQSNELRKKGKTPPDSRKTVVSASSDSTCTLA